MGADVVLVKEAEKADNDRDVYSLLFTPDGLGKLNRNEPVVLDASFPGVALLTTRFVFKQA